MYYLHSFLSIINIKHKQTHTHIYIAFSFSVADPIMTLAYSMQREKRISFKKSSGRSLKHSICPFSLSQRHDGDQQLPHNTSIVYNCSRMNFTAIPKGIPQNTEYLCVCMFIYMRVISEKGGCFARGTIDDVRAHEALYVCLSCGISFSHSFPFSLRL